eukprot:gene464-biopygen3094
MKGVGHNNIVLCPSTIGNIFFTLSASADDACPLTSADDACPLTSADDACPLTSADDACPLTSADDACPLTSPVDVGRGYGGCGERRVSNAPRRHSSRRVDVHYPPKAEWYHRK